MIKTSKRTRILASTVHARNEGTRYHYRRLNYSAVTHLWLSSVNNLFKIVSLLQKCLSQVFWILFVRSQNRKLLTFILLCRSAEMLRGVVGKTDAVSVLDISVVSLPSGASGCPRAAAASGARRRRGSGAPALHLPTPPSPTTAKLIVIRPF